MCKTFIFWIFDLYYDIYILISTHMKKIIGIIVHIAQPYFWYLNNINFSKHITEAAFRQALNSGVGVYGVYPPDLLV